MNRINALIRRDRGNSLCHVSAQENSVCNPGSEPDQRQDQPAPSLGLPASRAVRAKRLSHPVSGAQLEHSERTEAEKEADFTCKDQTAKVHPE